MCAPSLQPSHTLGLELGELAATDTHVSLTLQKQLEPRLVVLRKGIAAAALDLDFINELLKADWTREAL